MERDGYQSFKTNLPTDIPDKMLTFYLEKTVMVIREVAITQKSPQKMSRENSATLTDISKDYLEGHRENSLMQTLQNIPGIQAMGIGAGQSKPSIRGLGFNRVVVSQYGVKHEAQQWGSDHGLEIDQNDVGSVQIIKGPASVLYGSDAIAGVIDLRPLPLPAKDTLLGGINILAETNNSLLGANLGITARLGKWFYRASLTYSDYGDYKVPVDKIIFENYVFDLHRHRLRNTAGKEQDAGFSFGYAVKNFKTETFLSNVNSKNGFFANAHGLEVRTSQIEYDRSARDIDLPYHQANHFKVVNNTSFQINKHNFKINTGFQNNIREEHSEPVAHGYMPTPVGTLDRRYVKNTYTIEFMDQINLEGNHKLILGAASEYQHNEIGGWGFLIPGYDRSVNGFFIYDKWELSHKWFLNAALRYDTGFIRTRAYCDWFPSPSGGQEVFMQRAADRSYHFNSVSGSAGLSYIADGLSYKLNVGKSFRVPLASELSSDGLNYHMFRYEKGNVGLNPEVSYQADAEMAYSNNSFGLVVNPFINFFDNYIYLNPTSRYFETLQVYEYTQSKVLRYGGEIMLDYRPFEKWAVEASGAYVFARQKSGPKKNYSLPFSPPFRLLLSAKYTPDNMWCFNDVNLRADWHYSAQQNDIVPPEQTTPAYHSVDVSVTGKILLFKKSNRNPKLRLKINNIFNQTYFDHMSFYRIIGVPQPGRNASVSVSFPF